jgi:predicted enzyme related to lactoylglutathione lyase
MFMSTMTAQDTRKQKTTTPASEGQGNCPQTGSFCWNELLASDTAGAAKFYGQLFGWQAVEFPGPMKYSLLKQDGRDIGGLMQRPMENVPPHWLAYVKVENVDASFKKATTLGAKTLMPPMDIPDIGRIAVFQDPQGAALGIFQPAKE